MALLLYFVYKLLMRLMYRYGKEDSVLRRDGTPE